MDTGGARAPHKPTHRGGRPGPRPKTHSDDPYSPWQYDGKAYSLRTRATPRVHLTTRAHARTTAGILKYVSYATPAESVPVTPAGQDDLFWDSLQPLPGMKGGLEDDVMERSALYANDQLDDITQGKVILDPAAQVVRAEKLLEGFPEGQFREQNDSVFLNVPCWFLKCPEGDDVDEYIAGIVLDMGLATQLVSFRMHNTILTARRSFALVYRGLAACPSQVQEIGLTFCGLTNESIVPLCEWLATSLNVKYVRKIDLANNSISVNGLKSLVGSLENTALTHLSLHSNPLGESSIHQVVDLMVKITTLRSLDVSFCGLDDTAVVKLSTYLHTSTNITHLFLDGTRMNQQVSLMLLDAIHTNRSLIHVSLNYVLACTSQNFRDRLSTYLNRNLQLRTQKRQNQLRTSISHVMSMMAATRSFRSMRGQRSTEVEEPGSPLRPLPPATTATAGARRHSLVRRPSIIGRAPPPPPVTIPVVEAEEDGELEEAYDRSAATHHIGGWEWGGLTRGYTAYTSNEPTKRRRQRIKARQSTTFLLGSGAPGGGSSADTSTLDGDDALQAFGSSQFMFPKLM